LLIPLIELSELFSIDYFPIFISNKSDIEEEIIMVPVPASPNFTKGLLSVLEALVPTPLYISIYFL
jgi:hypothetical protein